MYCSVKLKGFGMVTSPKLKTRNSILLKPRCEELCGCISEPNKCIFIFKRPQRAQRSYCNHGYALGYGPQQTVALYRSFHSHMYMHLKADTGRLFKLHVHNLCGFYNVGGVVLQHLDLTPDLVQELQSNGVYHKSK